MRSQPEIRVCYQCFRHRIISGVVYGSGRFVFGVVLGEDDKLRPRLRKFAVVVEDGKLTAVDEILEYLNGVRKVFSVLPKPLWGTPFQRRVWCETGAIRYGETISYSNLALSVGNPRAARAVGQALNVNPIPILIPCHRIVRENGEVGGFRGGVEYKKYLLELENSL